MIAPAGPSAIGVVGVGNMGLAMLQRLRERGHKVLARDIRAETQDAIAAAGAVSMPDAASLARGCVLVLVAVVDAVQCDDVLFGARGLADGLHANSTVMICSTIAPGDVERFAARLAELGVPCIDAPMSGGPARARDGTMSLMVACADAVFARHEPVLRVLSSELVRLGERVGDGARTKLVNNLLAAVNLVGAAEAIALARRLGLDPSRTLAVIERSSAQSWIGSDRMVRALAHDFAPRAHTTLLAKDTTLALQMARGAGVEPPLGAAAQALFARACESGLGALDDASLLTLMQRLFNDRLS
jgi:L-threonate 2-dehydrogenase